MLSPAEENYLKTIYLLGHQGDFKVSVTSLASSLGNNPASIIDMLKKLTDKELIEYDKNKGATLTGSGLKTAISTVRKHRLWEFFLQEKLGYAWDEVHDIAEQMEHIKGENLTDRLDAFLGYPEFDPHGEAIPKSNGQVRNLINKTLFELEYGKKCKVVSVKDTSKLFLQYLQRLNISIGTILTALEKIEFDDSLIIQFEEGNKITISKKLAESIYITTLK